MLKYFDRIISETFLGKINFNGIGLIDIETTKFPADLWSNSSEKSLSEKLIYNFIEL